MPAMTKQTSRKRRRVCVRFHCSARLSPEPLAARFRGDETSCALQLWPPGALSDGWHEAMSSSELLLLLLLLKEEVKGESAGKRRRRGRGAALQGSLVLIHGL